MTSSGRRTIVSNLDDATILTYGERRMAGAAAAGPSVMSAVAAVASGGHAVRGEDPK